MAKNASDFGKIFYISELDLIEFQFSGFLKFEFRQSLEIGVFFGFGSGK